jgi:hypothetical protein
VANLKSQCWAFSTNITDMINAGEITSAQAGAQSSIQTGGPLGDNYLRVSNNNGNTAVLSPWPAAVGTFFWGQRLLIHNTNGMPSGPQAFIYFFSSTGLCQFYIGFNLTSRSINIYSGGFAGINFGSLLASSPPNAFPMETWFFCEIGAVIAISLGSVVIKVGAGPGSSTVTVLSYNGRTEYDATPSSTVVANAWNSTGNAWISTTHEYLNDSTGSAPNNSFLNDVRVLALEPVSNDSVALTPTGGSNWQNAALVPPVQGSDFNASPTVNAQDTYVVATLPTNLGVIYGVSVVAGMFKNDAGGRSMATVLKSGSTVQVNSNIVVSLSQLATRSPSALDPATSAAWLPSAFTAGAVKVGVKVTV